MYFSICFLLYVLVFISFILSCLLFFFFNDSYSFYQSQYLGYNPSKRFGYSVQYILLKSNVPVFLAALNALILAN